MTARTPRGTKKRLYEGFVRPTLEGLPQELKETVSGFLPASALGRMQVVSTKGKKMTQQELQSLCTQLPSEGEIESYVADVIERRIETRVAFYSPETPPKGDVLGDMANVRVFQLNVSGGRGLVHLVTDYTITYSTVDEVEWGIPVVGGTDTVVLKTNAGLEDRLPLLMRDSGVPDPFTVLEIVRRRGGCRREYEEKNDREYGVDIAEKYRNGTVTPFLNRIVDLKHYADVATTDNRDEAIREIPENDMTAMRNYQVNVEKSRLLIWAWMGFVDREVIDQYIENWTTPADRIALMEQAREVVRYYDADNASDYLEGKSERGEDVLLPNHSEIIAYLLNEMKEGRAIKLALFDPNHDGGKFAVRLVMSDEDDDVQYLRYTTMTILVPSTRRSDYAYKISPSSKVVFSDAELDVELMAYLDPTTLLAVMKSRLVAAEDPTYGESVVQDYLKRVMEPYLSPFLQSTETAYTENYALIIEQDLKVSLENVEERQMLRQLILLVEGWLEGRDEMPQLLYDLDEPVMAIKRFGETYVSLDSSERPEVPMDDLAGPEEGEGEAEEVSEEEAAREEADIPPEDEGEGDDIGEEDEEDDE